MLRNILGGGASYDSFLKLPSPSSVRRIDVSATQLTQFVGRLETAAVSA